MRGSMSIQMLVIMVPVLFGMMGFAIDLGRLYLVRGELNQAANAMALAAASQLNGTTAANTAVMNVLPPPVGTGPTYNYNFGGLQLGVDSTSFTSTVNPPACFATAADAAAGTGGGTDCSAAQFVQVSVSAQAPLLFWSLLPGGQSRRTSIAAQAVAGISAPVCTACNIVPIAIAALDAGDTADFGFIKDTLYTLSYQCSGGTLPVNIPGTTSIGPAGLSTIPFEILNRLDPNNALLTESDQLYMSGAQGLVSSLNPTPNALTTTPNTPLACVNMGDAEQVWASAVPGMCSLAISSVEAALCGVYSRLDNQSIPAVCPTAVPNFDALSVAHAPDTNAAEPMADPFASYAGNGRRIVTVAIVDALAANTAVPMTVLGFRQFLVTANADGTYFNPGDPNGRVPVLYIGAAAPVQQGWFDTRFAPACPVGSFSGPGKVVLHQ